MKTINLVVRIGESELWRNYSPDTDEEDLAEGVKEMLEAIRSAEENN